MFSFDFYHRYRNYRIFTNDEIDVLNKDTIEAIYNSQMFVDKQYSKGMILIGVNILDWESDHFELPMAKVEILTTRNIDPKLLANEIKKILFKHNQLYGCKHYSVDVDMDNYLVMNACFLAGFEVLDFKKTYFTDRLHDTPRMKRFSNNVRKYEAGDLSEVIDIFYNANFVTKFSRDKYLPTELVKALYVKWIVSLIDDFPAKSNVLVVEKNNRVIACGAVGEKKILNTKIRTGTLYACSKEGIGFYEPTLWRAASEAIETHGLVDATISFSSNAAIRVIDNLRPTNKVNHACLRLYIE